MIELSVALGDFDDSLYDKLGLGDENKSPSDAPPPTDATPAESFIAKEVLSSSPQKKKPKIEVIE